MWHHGSLSEGSLICMNWSVLSSIRKASTLPSSPSKWSLLIQLRRHSLRGGVLLGILARGVPPSSSNPDPISDQRMWYIIHTHFQTRPPKSIPIFRPGLYVITTSIRAKTQKLFKSIWNSHISLSFLLIWKCSYTPVVPSKTIPDSRPKWAECISVFRPKRRKNPTRWGGTYLYSLNNGVPPPPPPFRYSVYLLSNLVQ